MLGCMFDVLLMVSIGASFRLKGVECGSSGEWAGFVPDLMLYAPSAFPEYKHAKVVANCWLDMCDLYEKFEGHELWQKLSIQLKPRKGIFAASFIGKRKLTLCPTGLHLKHSINKPAEEPLFPLIMPDDDFHVWSVPVRILPKAEDEPGCVNPCFLVQALSSEADCNMALIYTRSSRCVVKHGKFTWAPTQKVEQEIVWFGINKWVRHFVRF